MDSCLLPMQAPFFLARYCEINPPIYTGGCYAHSEQQLARHHEILTARWLHENFMVPFLHNLIYIDQDFSEKSISMQAKLFCTSKMVGICHLAQLQELCKKILRLTICIHTKGCLVQVGNGIELEAVGLQFEPCRWRPCGVTWDSSRTVVVIKLRRTSKKNRGI